MSFRSPAIVFGRFREHVASLLKFGHRGISKMRTRTASNDTAENDLRRRNRDISKPPVRYVQQRTAAEKAYVHGDQNREHMDGCTANCSRTTRKTVDAARTLAKNDGAYWLRRGLTGLSISAWAKYPR